MKTWKQYNEEITNQSGNTVQSGNTAVAKVEEKPESVIKYDNTKQKVTNTDNTKKETLTIIEDYNEELLLLAKNVKLHIDKKYQSEIIKKYFANK